MSKKWFFSYYGNSYYENLKASGIIYLNNSLKSYIAIEGRVNSYNLENLGDSANAICSICRSIEHFMKLKLLKTDPILLYPLPKKIEDYITIKSINISKDNPEDFLRKLPGKTITYKNCIERLKVVTEKDNYDFTIFEKLYALRNSIEHHWDRNTKFLQENIGIMSNKIIPSIKAFIENILEENSVDYFDSSLLLDVERIDRAIEKGHSLDTERRIDEIREIYDNNREKLIDREKFPKMYARMDEIETEIDCPVCNNKFNLKWDFEVDYDMDGPVGAYPDPKCLFCDNCKLYMEGPELGEYFPEGLKELEETIAEESYDYDYF